MNLLDLPMELVSNVIDHLDTPKHLSAMLLVNRLLHQAFTRHLYRIDIKHHHSSALLWAVTHHQLLIAEKSLQERVHLPKEDDQILQDALLLAVRGGDCAMVALLCAHGAQVDSPFQPGEAVEKAYNALDKGQIGWLEYALHLACQLANAEMANLLLSMGASVDKQDTIHGHALLISSRVGSEEILHSLLESGARIDARAGCCLETALQAASLLGNVRAAKLLIDHGADVNAYGGHYGTALQAASWMGRRAVVKLLLRSDANVDAPGVRFGNARQAALLGGHRRVEGLLQYWSWRRRLRRKVGL